MMDNAAPSRCHRPGALTPWGLSNTIGTAMHQKVEEMSEVGMDKPVDIGAEEFEAEVLLVEDRPVFVDFWSETCGHCLTLNPHFEQAAGENQNVKFAKISFQQGGDRFKDYGVRATPTLILFSGGEELARIVGAKRAEELAEWLAEQLGD